MGNQQTYLENLRHALENTRLVQLVLAGRQELTDLRVGAKFAKTAKPVTQLRHVYFPVLSGCDPANVKPEVQQRALECLIVHLLGCQKCREKETKKGVHDVVPDRARWARDTESEAG